MDIFFAGGLADGVAGFVIVIHTFGDYSSACAWPHADRCNAQASAYRQRPGESLGTGDK